MPKRSACAARVAAMADDGLTELAAAAGERRCRDGCGFSTHAEAAAPYRPDPTCPGCGAAGPSGDGRSESGPQGCRCGGCGTRLDSLAGTVPERCGKEPAARVGLASPMRLDVPPGAAVDGHRGRVVPRDGAWIDGAHASDTDLAHGCGEARRRGPSRQRPRTAVAIDVHVCSVKLF